MTKEELEKENAELKKQLEMSVKVYNDNLDYSYHIEEQLTKSKELLKKENAELKARLDAINLLTPELEKLSKLKKQQLTEAKELLKRWVDDKVYTVSEQKDLIADTEQFLEEVKEK